LALGLPTTQSAKQNQPRINAKDANHIFSF
jgi:hypothetical protein